MKKKARVHFPVNKRSQAGAVGKKGRELRNPASGGCATTRGDARDEPGGDGAVLTPLCLRGAKDANLRPKSARRERRGTDGRGGGGGGGEHREKERTGAE